MGRGSQTGSSQTTASGGFSQVLGPRSGSTNRANHYRWIIADPPRTTSLKLTEAIVEGITCSTDFATPLAILQTYADHLGHAPLLDQVYEAMVDRSLSRNEYRDDLTLSKKLQTAQIIRILSRVAVQDEATHRERAVHLYDDDGQLVCGYQGTLYPISRDHWADNLMALGDPDLQIVQCQGYCQTCLDAFIDQPERWPEAREHSWDGWCRDIGNEAWPAQCTKRFRQQFLQALAAPTAFDANTLADLEKDAYHSTCAERFGSVLAADGRESAARILDRTLTEHEARAAERLDPDTWAAFVRRTIETPTAHYNGALRAEVQADLAAVLADQA